MKKIFDIDCIGMCASVLCLIHCLCLPWLMALVGVYFGSFFESPNFHNIMLVVAILIGLPVFVLSFIRYKSKLILVTGVVGLSLTTFGTMKSDNCCPSVSTEAACDDGSECSTECSEEETIILSKSLDKAAACGGDSECSTECSGDDAIVLNENIDEDSSENIQAQGFNAVPLGVSLLVFAHFLNFRKRKSCKHVCCG
ncbi:MAG: MerC domain-containing protein [Lentisphaeraceae bacterium]|nr:MerC domain-containing protein [Lentisphaeraceae bacterium]